MRRHVQINDAMTNEKIGSGMLVAWGVNYGELLEGVGNYSVALVEMSDGSVAEFLPIQIKFTHEDG